MFFLKLVQQVFREINKAELGEPKTKFSHLLQTVVISKLTKTLEGNLAELSEAILYLYLFCRHFQVSLNNFLQSLCCFSQSCKFLSGLINFVSEFLGLVCYFYYFNLFFLLVFFKESCGAADQCLHFIFNLQKIIVHRVVKAFPLVEL